MKVAEIVKLAADAEKKLRVHLAADQHGLAQMQWERLGRLHWALREQVRKKGVGAAKAMPRMEQQIKECGKIAQKIRVI